MKIESMYKGLQWERDESAARRTELETRLAALDAPEAEKTRLRTEHFAQEMAFLRARRRPMSEADFESISMIGRGGAGEVFLVRHRASGAYYAMKKLRKKNMVDKGTERHAWSEHHLLVAANHPFVCNLCFAFQSNDHLFLVMEYLAGSDLLNLLQERETLTEEECKFYVAEMVVAVDFVHKLGFIHRDVKPDNILIDKNGHLKLPDFGLCKNFNVDMGSLSRTADGLQASNGRSSNRSSLSLAARAAEWKKGARKQAFSAVGT